MNVARVNPFVSAECPVTVHDQMKLLRAHSHAKPRPRKREIRPRDLFEPKHPAIKLARLLQIADRQAHVVDRFEFHKATVA